LEPFRDEDSPSPDDVFLQLESSFKKYKKAQILRKAKRIVTGGLDLVGSIPGL
jgi:hypothetical protein